MVDHFGYTFPSDVHKVAHRDYGETLMKFISLICLTLLSGCLSYDKFYVHQAPSKYGPSESVIYIDANPDADKTYELLLKEFLVVGRVDLSATSVDREPYIVLGKKVGADFVAVSMKFKGRETVDSSIEVPTVNTTYLSGYGSFGTYSGTATTYGTKSIPISYTVKRYDQTGIFLKRINKNARAPWEYRKSDFKKYAASSEFNGVWKNDNYTIEVISSDAEVVAFVLDAGQEPKSELATVNPTLKWSKGDLKFRFDRASKLGFYLMAIKSPRPAKYAINKFGHLEFELSKKHKFTFMRVTGS